MAQKPVNVYFEIIALLLSLIVGIFILWDRPEWQYSEEVRRGIAITGAWLQLVGAILISFEFLRGPLAEEQLADYQSQKEELSRNFEENVLPNKHSKQGMEMMREHIESRMRLDETYRPVRFFEITVRRVYAIGLTSICLGYILQLATS